MIAETEELSVTFGTTRALDRVSLRIPEGSVGLLGPNGAGKSTLLKTLLGFVVPSGGRASVLGLDVARDPLQIRARVGYMPESDAILPGLDAVATVTLAAELGGIDRMEALSRAHEMLSYVGLGEARYRDVAGYSAGMKARVKLAQALAADPDLLLLDEPTNGLDPEGRTEMLGLIRDIRSRYGVHVLLSSHLLPDVEEVCEHVVLVESGRIAVAAPIRELKVLREQRYEIAYRGDHAAFRRELLGQGLAVVGDDPALVVQVPADRGTEGLLRAAVAAGGELRRMVRRERTLTEVFVEAVRGRPAAGAAG